MELNEAILLKCYDSMDDGRARFTAHTSFEDPSTGARALLRIPRSKTPAPANVAPRESIEVLVFWTPETVSATTAAVAPAQEL
jgi:hypothetical protein